MLDKETKDRINTARDILVGKVPDPKSQVEQITIALIYKFMDDMDLEAEELGGARSFFSGEYAPYAWHKLFDPAVGGETRLQRYSEALLRLGLNPHLPALFRDIFKNAYLPYRDPETLSSFLKIINGFRYDHSERLGDAFEFLLSVLGSQGDAGQFRTPRHLIDFMTAMVDPQKDETVLDPACGTAGFLISSYKHILKHNSANYDPQADPSAFELHGISLDELGAANGKKYKGDRLSPDDRKRLVQNFRGYDISPDMVRLSLVNLYLHGFSEPRIYEYDTLTSEALWNEYYDVILANPPFMSPKGGIRPHSRFSIASNRSEVLFVDYIAEHLTPRGRAAIIVPEGIIFQTGTAYKALRKMLVDSGFLVGVVSLPAGVFNPYSGVKTSILWIDKTLASKTDKLLFLKIENDGFDLGAQRRPLKSSELPEAFRQIEAYKRALQTGTPFDAKHLPNVALVEKAKVAEGGEYGLSGERYKAKSFDSSNLIELVSLHSVVNRISETIIPNEHSGQVQYVGLENIESNTGGIIGNLRAQYSEIKSAKTVFKSNDILFGKLRPNLNKVALPDFDGICSTDIYVFRVKPDKYYPKLLQKVLANETFNVEVLKGISGAQLPRVSYEYLSHLQIPLPPLPVQEEIVAEIEGYERIIAGARQVVESYRPRIEIQPEWEWVELGEVAKQYSGGTPSKQKPEFWEGAIPWVSPKDMKQDFLTDTEDHISEDAVRNSSTKFAGPNTLLVVVRSGILKHSLPLAITQRKMCFNQDIIAINTNEGKLNVLFLFYYLKTKSQEILNEGIKPGVTVQSFHSGYFSKFKIPLPDLPTQARMVAAIEREQALVSGCRELMAVMEEKVRRRVAGVWGE